MRGCRKSFYVNLSRIQENGHVVATYLIRSRYEAELIRPREHQTEEPLTRKLIMSSELITSVVRPLAPGTDNRPFCDSKHQSSAQFRRPCLALSHCHRSQCLIQSPSRCHGLCPSHSRRQSSQCHSRAHCHWQGPRTCPSPARCHSQRSCRRGLSHSQFLSRSQCRSLCLRSPSLSRRQSLAPCRCHCQRSHSPSLSPSRQQSPSPRHGLALDPSRGQGPCQRQRSRSLSRGHSPCRCQGLSQSPRSSKENSCQK